MLGYKPNGMELWDTWHVVRDDEIHMLHLQFLSPQSPRETWEGQCIGHAVSRDLVHWEEKPLALCPGEAGGLDDMGPWTGCVYFYEDTYYFYYTMRSSSDGGKTQHIGLATSKDLEHWTRYEGNPVISPDARWYIGHQSPLPNGVVDCRDLIVQKNPDGPGWYGFFAARTPGKYITEGPAIGAAFSLDLIHWECLPPVFVPEKYACIEVPDVFYLNGKWYLTCLVSHGYGNRGIFDEPNLCEGTIYAAADHILGPYHELEKDYLLIAGDRSCGYSCRSFAFKGKRYGFFTERTSNTLSMPMELWTTPEGYLRYRYSTFTALTRSEKLIDASRPVEINFLPFCHGNWEMRGGNFTYENGRYIGEAKDGWQIADLTPVSRNVEMKATVTIQKGVAAGLVLRRDTNSLSSIDDMVFFMDAREKVVRAGRSLYFSESWYRHWNIEEGKAYEMRVSIRQPRVEVYIDDCLVLNFAYDNIPQEQNPSLGLFIDRGYAEFQDIEAYELLE